MLLYDMFCPNCNRDYGESLFNSLAEYEDIKNRPRCVKCESPLERKAVQGFNVNKRKAESEKKMPILHLGLKSFCGCEAHFFLTPFWGYQLMHFCEEATSKYKKRREETLRISRILMQPSQN